MLSDQVWFTAFQVLLGFVFLYAFFRKENSPASGVSRGSKSREIMKKPISPVVNLLLVVLFSITTFPEGGKVMWYLLDLAIVNYLFLWNGWFVNKVIGVYSQWENRDFNPHAHN